MCGIKTDPAKVERISEWPAPENVTGFMSFLRLAGYYRLFVLNFAKAGRPLHKLTEADIDILLYQDISEELILGTDASNHGVGVVLVAYGRRTLTEAERNYFVTRN